MTGVRFTRRPIKRRTAPPIPSAPKRLTINSRVVPDERYDQIERTLMSRRDLRASQRSTREMHVVRTAADRPAIAGRSRWIFFENDLGGVRRAVMGEARHQGLVVEDGRDALRRHREIRDGFDRADHHAEFLALDRAGFDIHLHARLDPLALL